MNPHDNQEILEAIGKQHPEWVSPDGECRPCESYLHELASRLDFSPPETTEEQ